MINSKQRLRPISVGLLIISLVLYILTAPIFSLPFCTGLDCSGGFGLNYFFAHHIQLGKDVLYSYGPYGFLNGTLPVANNILVAIVLQTLLKTGFIFSLLHLFFLKKKHLWQAILVVSLTIFLSLFTDFTLMIIFFVPVALMLGRESKRQGWYLLACFVAAFGLCYKSVAGVTTFAALFFFFLSEYALKKNWQTPFQYMLQTIAATLLFWFVAYGNFEGLLEYVLSLPEFAQGQASAMTQNPENNWLALSVMFSGFLILPLFFRNQDKNVETPDTQINFSVMAFWATMILPTYLFWKYAYTRQDHSIFFMMYAVMFFVILVGYIQKLNWKLITAVVLVFGGMYANMKYSGYDHVKLTQMKVQAQGIQHVLDILNYPAFIQKLESQSKTTLASHRLSSAMLKQAEQGTIDFYPWETTYAAANPELHWSPRPVYQSHMTFRPYFDTKNQAFLGSVTGPTFILWEKDHRGGKMGSIDYRYLLNDDPLTIQAILTKFRPVMEDAQLVLFQRSDLGMLKPPIPLKTENSRMQRYRWGQWISIPTQFTQADLEQSKNQSQKPILSGLLRAKVVASPTILAKIKRALYKENDAWIEYRLTDGSIKKHRLVLDNMVSGLVAAPYVTEMSIPWKCIPVTAIRLTHSKSDLYAPNIKINWQVLLSQ